MINKFKLILFAVFFIYQNLAFSKTNDNKDFNPRYLSNYLSAIILQDNNDSIKYFNLSKNLIDEHKGFLKNYAFNLVINGKVQESINIIKKNKNKSNSDFFEAKLLLLTENIKNKNFDQNIKLFKEIEKFRDYSNYYYIIL